MLDGKTQKVEYESLPNICFQCEKYDHNKESCPNHIEENGNPGELDQHVNIFGKQMVNKTSDDNQSTPKLGPWMVVSRKGKPHIDKARELGHDSERGHWGSFGKESRFGILASVNEENPNHGINKSYPITMNCNVPTSNSTTIPLVLRNQHIKKKNQNSTPNLSIVIRADFSIHGPNTANQPNAIDATLVQLPHTLHSKTNIHVNQTSQHVPTIVPTSLNPLYHSTIPFTTVASTNNSSALPLPVAKLRTIY